MVGLDLDKIAARHRSMERRANELGRWVTPEDDEHPGMEAHEDRGALLEHVAHCEVFIAVLTSALRGAEWSGAYGRCPDCCARREEGHSDACRIAAALAVRVRPVLESGLLQHVREEG